MFSLLSTATAALASLCVVSASPLLARQSGCSASVSSFQLYAYNVSTLNANLTGAPLTVGFRAWTGSATGSYFATLVTEDSYRTNNQNTPSLTLTSGALLPNASGASSAALSISNGTYLQFEISDSAGELPESVESYCTASGEGQYSLLAVNGDSESFSLCQSYTPYYWGTPYNVVYQATDDSSDNNHIYDYSTCYAVRLQVVPETS